MPNKYDKHLQPIKGFKADPDKLAAVAERRKALKAAKGRGKPALSDEPALLSVNPSPATVAAVVADEPKPPRRGPGRPAREAKPE